MSNYELVPPKSKVISFKSAIDVGLTFHLKVFDFDEDEEYQNLLFKHVKKTKAGKFKKDKDNNFVIDNKQYYVDLFRLGVDKITGLKGKNYEPSSWSVIKEIGNKIIQINTVVNTKK